MIHEGSAELLFSLLVERMKQKLRVRHLMLVDVLPQLPFCAPQTLTADQDERASKTYKRLRLNIFLVDWCNLVNT